MVQCWIWLVITARMDVDVTSDVQYGLLECRLDFELESAKLERVGMLGWREKV